MKEKSRAFYQSLLDYFDRHPMQARMVVLAMSIGFVLVAIGVMLNLATTDSILKIIHLIP